MAKFKFLVILLISFLLGDTVSAQSKIDSLMPVRGFCIAAPEPEQLDAFVKFIGEELAPRKVNALILRVDYNYQFESHPELRDKVALSKADVKKMVAKRTASV